MWTLSRRAFLAHGARLALAEGVGAFLLPAPTTVAARRRVRARPIGQPAVQTHVASAEWAGPWVDVKVVGIGAGGGNALGRMVEHGIDGVEPVTVHADLSVSVGPIAQLRLRNATQRQPMGSSLAAALGAAGDSSSEVHAPLFGGDLVLIAADVGELAGTLVAPAIARNARRTGALTVAVVTRPVGLEGRRKAAVGVATLKREADVVIVIPRLDALCVPGTKSGSQTAELADDAVYQCMLAIVELVAVPGLISVDFSDVSMIMRGHGPLGQVGIGHGRGEYAAVKAAQAAISSAFLEASLRDASGVIFGVRTDGDLLLSDVVEAGEVILRAAPNSGLIFGVNIDRGMGKEIVATVIATWLDPATSPARSARP